MQLEIELATYKRMLSEFLKEHEDEYVLIKATGLRDSGKRKPRRLPPLMNDFHFNLFL